MEDNIKYGIGKLCGFDEKDNKDFIKYVAPATKVPKSITLRLTKPKKRGRPSKKDKELYDKDFTLEIPEGTTIENLSQELQNQVDKRKLPIKFI